MKTQNCIIIATIVTIVLTNIDISTYDKYKDSGTLDDVKNTDILFIAVPTVFKHSTNEYNKDALHDVLIQLKDYQGIILIKCTLEPTVTESLVQKYQLKLIHNPEFLSASSNIDDFVNQTHIVLGQSSLITNNDMDKGDADEFISKPATI